MNTLNELKSIQQSLDKVIGYLEGAMQPTEPTKRTIKIPVFSERIERGDAKIHLITPQTVVSMGTVESGNIYPMSVINVNGKLVFYWTDFHAQKAATNDFTLTLNGNDSGFYMHDISYRDGMYFGLFEQKDTILLATGHNGQDFNVENKINTHGAYDTRHAFGQINDNIIEIHGRVRGDDWNESNERLRDRRGVKLLRYNRNTGATEWYGTIDPIDHTEGGRSKYKTNRFRNSYYSSDSNMIGDTELINIGVYFQDEMRIPKQRPERINGTGETYPVPFVKRGLKWEPLTTTDATLLTLTKHERPSSNGDMEVGQIHAGSFAWIDGDLVQPYGVRNDTHYEFGEIPFKKSEHFLARWGNGRLAYLTDGTIEVDGKVVGLEYDGAVPAVMGNQIIVHRDSKLYYVEVEE